MRLMQTTTVHAAFLLGLSIFATSNILGQSSGRQPDAASAAYQARLDKLKQIAENKAVYAAEIVRRWEADAREMGKWDENYAAELEAALMKLDPEKLLLADEAPSYGQLRHVLMTGRLSETIVLNPSDKVVNGSLGSSISDLVFTPITPCRILDTRFATLGAITTNTTRNVDVDGTSFTSQGGNAGVCGVPNNVAAAVAITLTVTGPVGPGYLTAFSYCTTRPTASTINYAAGETTATGAIVPMCGGVGADLSLYAFTTTHALIDVVGYYAAPTYTALDCTTATSPSTSVPVNTWYRIDATCPVGRTATGGGWDVPTLGTLLYPNVWVTSVPASVVGINGWSVWVDNQSAAARNVTAYAVCCRIPGR